MRALVLVAAACASQQAAKPSAPAAKRDDALCDVLKRVLDAAPATFDAIKDGEGVTDGPTSWRSTVQLGGGVETEILDGYMGIIWTAKWPAIYPREAAKQRYGEMRASVGACPALAGRATSEKLHKGTDGYSELETTWAGSPGISLTVESVSIFMEVVSRPPP